MSSGVTNLMSKATEIMSKARTCTDLAKIGVTTSGTYQLDPDGKDTGADPIVVLCDFETNTTEIVHNLNAETLMEKCDEPAFGCHKNSLDYNVPMSQIEALIRLSPKCE